MTNSINLNERFKYGFSHTIISGLIAFIICFFIQLIMNYVFFRTKAYLSKEVITLFKKINKKYLIFLCVSLLIMIIISYAIITFNEVYRGGISDLISGTFWTFIFVQIMPFFYCLILALLKYLKNKNN